MKIPEFIVAPLANAIVARFSQRNPDFVVGVDNPEGAYLERWYVTPWRRLQSRLRTRAEQRPSPINRAAAWLVGLLPNVYVHHFMRDDDDRALHDHPSFALSLILRTGYTEHTIANGGIHRRRFHGPGSLRFLGTRYAHRIELLKISDFVATQPHNKTPIGCWTLFVFGPTVRDWGFHCPERGWVHWKEFTATGQPGEIGQGCDA